MPDFRNLQGGDIGGARLTAGLKRQYVFIKQAGTLTLTKDFPPVVYLDADSASQKIILPAPAASDELSFWILNVDAALTALVRDNGDTVTVKSLAPGIGGHFHCANGVWRALI